MASFSSTLLDSIYRSIDGQQDTNNNVKDDHDHVRKNKSTNMNMNRIPRSKSMANFERNPRSVPLNSSSDSDAKTTSKPAVRTTHLQPLSPAARFATFLNNMFNKRNRRPRTNKFTNNHPAASSNSRSCLTKTPSSNNAKRSVRFVDHLELLNTYQTDDDDDDDDLFELDHLSVIGIENELPLYETTHLSNNRPIANGFVI